MPPPNLAPGPPPAEGLDTRSRILCAAARLFRERGFHGTTTRAISEIVGILSGSLFYYFRSKNEILIAVMKEASLLLLNESTAAIAKAVTPRERVHALLLVQLQGLLGQDTRDLYAVMIHEWRTLNPDAQAELTPYRSRYVAMWKEVLEHCEKAGVLRSEPHAVRLALQGAVNWSSIWFKLDGRLSIEQFARILEDLILQPR